MPMPSLLTPAAVAQDFEFFDNTELVTVRYVDPDTGATVYEAEDVLALARTRPTEVENAVGVARCKWHVKRADVKTADGAPFEVLPPARIIEACGRTWTVQKSTLVTWNTRYECECVATPADAQA